MNYPYYGNPYMPPMQDNLAQLRQQQMQTIPPMPQNPLPQSGVQWVSGEQEARSWMVAPNAAVALWDSTAPTVYLKQAASSLQIATTGNVTVSSSLAASFST